MGKELKLLAHVNSKLDETFFYYDSEYHRAIGEEDDLIKRIKVNLAPELAFTRYGLCGICLYQCLVNNVSFPSNPYDIRENLKAAEQILKKINKKTIEERVMKYLKPYKRFDKKLLSYIQKVSSKLFPKEG